MAEKAIEGRVIRSLSALHPYDYHWAVVEYESRRITYVRPMSTQLRWNETEHLFWSEGIFP